MFDQLDMLFEIMIKDFEPSIKEQCREEYNTLKSSGETLGDIFKSILNDPESLEKFLKEVDRRHGN